MEQIPPVIARTRLDDVRLTVSDRTAVDALLEALADRVELSVQQAYDALFPGRTTAATTKALERLVKQVNTSAEQDGVDLRLEVRGAKKLGPTGRTLGFVAERVEQAGDPLREHDAVRDTLIKDRSATRLGPRRIVLCHAAQDDKHAKQLWDLVMEALGCDDARFSVWRTDRDVLAGDDADHQFRKAVAEGDLVIVALSNALLRQSETRDVVLRQVEATGLMVAPVLLRSLSPMAEPTGFDRTIYPAEGKPFAAVRGDSAREEWVHGLVDQVHRLLSRPPARTAPDMGLRDRRALKADRSDGIFALRARPGSMEPNLPAENHADAGHVDDVVSFLLNWARDPKDSPLAALLGEYGAGKTITCQELTERLRAEPVPGQPEPLYFDLRKVGNLDRGVPVLADILTECIRFGWESGGAPKPTGEEVIARARKNRTLFVIDGLDEVLVRLTAAQGVAFTHELLKLRPIRTRSGVKAPFAGEDTKVLLSCRTHYFRSLREQSRHFLEHDRGLSTAEDYTALILLPLTDEQIHSYLGKTLPDRDATQVMDMLRAVHDLSDLATRPYTLAKVAAQVPFIERRLAEQRSVHAATIYQQVLHDWLARDHGKHRLRPDHKLALMARLAAWSWKRGDRRLDSTDLDDWLDEQLATDDVLRRRYAAISRDELEEDLRTATFVVRSDANGPDRPDFQFAHTSIHEYFLAQHLCDALRDDLRAEWCLPMPSDETLDFLGQLIADSDDTAFLTARLSEWRAPYLAQASELGLRYTLRAHEHGWPRSAIAGCDLTGASLRHWNFSGSEKNYLLFTSATLVDADLRDTRWDHVILSHSNLSGARLDRSTLHRTNFSGSTLRNADLTGAFLHDCRMDDADLSDVITTGLRHVHSGDVLPAPPQPARTELETTDQDVDVTDMMFNPDETRLLTANGDGSVWIRDATTGERIVALPHHARTHECVAFSADGSTLVTVDDDHTAHVWDGTTGNRLRTLPDVGEVFDAAVDAAGSRLATTDGEGVVCVWDCITGEQLLSLEHIDHMSRLAISPDGSRVATTAGGRSIVRVWNSTTGEQLLSLEHTDVGRTVVFDSQGARLATTSREGGKIIARVCNSTTGEQLLSLEHTGLVWGGPAFSLDGSRLATAGNEGTVYVWNSTTGQQLLNFTGTAREISSIRFSPSGSKLATVNHFGEAAVWDATTGERLLTPGVNSAANVFGVALSPDGTRLATSGDGSAWIWDYTTGQLIATLVGHTSFVRHLVFSPDGSRLATASDDQTARVWDSTTGEQLLTITDHEEVADLDGVNGVVFSPDGSRLATAGDDETARVWDSTTGKQLLVLTGHTRLVWSVAFSPDGSRLATASNDGSVRVWDSTTGEQLLILTGHEAALSTVAFSPDGTQLATAGDDNTTRLWDSVTGDLLLTIASQADEVNAVVFSADGSRLATADSDAKAELWDIATQRLVWRAKHLPGGEAASWSPVDNRLLFASDGAWRTLRAACFDEEGRPLGLQPYERYYSLPE